MYGSFLPVSMPAQLLFVLMTLRLLLPPGICICKLTSPVSRAAVLLLGGQPNGDPVDLEDDHHPGCPASHLDSGLGVQPAGPGPLDPGSLGHRTIETELLFSIPSLADLPSPPSQPPADRLHSLCVLVV